jgi:hypothetical protein
MKNRTLILASLLSILLFTACNKERKWEIEIVAIDEITYNSADFEIVFELGKSINQRGGYYFGIDPELNPENSKIGEFNLYNSRVFEFEIDKLYANQNYYMQCFIEGEEEDHFSEIKTFKTLDLPALECSVSPGQVYFTGNGTTETVSNLEATSGIGSSPFSFKVVTDVGDFTFTFNERPKSGIYTTISSVTDLDSEFNKPFSVVIGGLYSSGGSGGYYRALPNGEIQVKSNTDGSISIAFCALALKRDGGGAGPVDQEITGMIVE